MEDQPQTSPQRRWVGWVLPRRGKRKWAIVRLAVVAIVVFIFRYEAAAYAVGGYNLIWRETTGATGNNATCVAVLRHLRGPGLRMLVRIGKPADLALVDDPAALPTLLEMAGHDADPAVRVAALRALGRMSDGRIPAVFIHALCDGSSNVRMTAAIVVTQCTDPRYREAFTLAAAETDGPWVKGVLTRAIQNLLPPEDSAPPGVSAGASATRPATQAAMEPAPQRTVRVAAIQFMSEFGNPQRNRTRLEALVRDAAKHGAKLISVPETAITGYTTYDLETTWQREGGRVTGGLTGRSPADAAETVPGPTTKYFSPIAKELGIYLTVTFVESEPATGKYFNTIVLLGPTGEILLHYRKLNPWPYAETGWASAGDRGLQTVDTPFGRLGILVCFDVNFEPANLQRLHVDTLLYCIAWVDIEGSNWFAVGLPGVARQCHLNIVGANWTMPAEQKWFGYGQSEIIDHTGRVLARVKGNVGEEIIYADLDLPAGAGRK